MIQNLKAVVMDIDGTLVEKGGQIMPETYDALIRLHEAGVLIGLASGRPVDDYMRRYPKFWNLPFEFDLLIGMNGGHLSDRFHEGVTEFYPLSAEKIREIKETLAPLDLNAQIYENSQLIAERWDDLVAASAIRNMQEVVISPFPDRMYRHGNAKIQFRYEEERDAEIDAFVAAHSFPEHVRWVKTSPGIIEFMDERTNKGVALSEFAKRNNIPMDSIMAFGDMDNDMEMLAAAGWGVCLINGCEASKNAADAITEYPVTEDGMGRYLNAHVFGKII